MKKTIKIVVVLLLFLVICTITYYYDGHKTIQASERNLQEQEVLKQKVDTPEQKIDVVTAYRLIAPLKENARKNEPAQLIGYREKAGLSSNGLKIHGTLSEIDFYRNGYILQLNRVERYSIKEERERIFFVRVQISLPRNVKWKDDTGKQLEIYLVSRIGKPIVIYGLFSGVGTSGLEKSSTDYFVMIDNVWRIDDVKMP